MPYRVLADAVVLLHLAWIVFLVFGALLGARYRPLKVFHILGLAFAMTIQVFGWYCPLTHLEVWFRARHDPSLTYTGSFIVHYAEKIVYVELSRGLVFAMSTLLCAFNAWYYLRKRRPD